MFQIQFMHIILKFDDGKVCKFKNTKVANSGHLKRYCITNIHDCQDISFSYSLPLLTSSNSLLDTFIG